MAKILRKFQESRKTQVPILNIFVGQKSIFRRHCIQNVKDSIQICVYKINKENVAHFIQLISMKAKKILRISHTQFREKLIKLRLG